MLYFAYGSNLNHFQMKRRCKDSKFIKKINHKETFEHFDVIIDDGSHKLSDQLNALNHFYEYLVGGGFYVIEDYKFPDYFKHLKDVNDIKINEIILFIKKSNKPIKIKDLQKNVWHQVAELETHTVETHIYRLRKKIKEKFQDDNFIKSTKNGYEIN